MPGEWTINLRLDEFIEGVESRMTEALARGMEHLHQVVTPLVPVENSNLVGSGSITVEGDEAQLYYPGPYALYQHEGVYYRHGRFGAPLRHTHGESFFLEGPLVREADTITQIVGETLLGAS